MSCPLTRLPNPYVLQVGAPKLSKKRLEELEKAFEARNRKQDTFFDHRATRTKGVEEAEQGHTTQNPADTAPAANKQPVTEQDIQSGPSAPLSHKIRKKLNNDQLKAQISLISNEMKRFVDQDKTLLKRYAGFAAHVKSLVAKVEQETRTKQKMQSQVALNKAKQELQLAKTTYETNSRKVDDCLHRLQDLQDELTRRQKRQKFSSEVSTTQEPDAGTSSSEDEDDIEKKEEHAKQSQESAALAQSRSVEINKKKAHRIAQQMEALKAKEAYDEGKKNMRYKPKRLHVLDPDLNCFKELVNFCKNLAAESKGTLYAVMQQYVRTGDMEPDLWKLGTSAVALSQNHGIPMTPQQISHQLIRSFLHMHDVSLQAVIYAYLRYYYGLISESEAFTALVYAIQHEIKYYYHLSEVWDIAILRSLFKEFNINAYNTQPASTQQMTQPNNTNAPALSTETPFQTSVFLAHTDIQYAYENESFFKFEVDGDDHCFYYAFWILTINDFQRATFLRTPGSAREYQQATEQKHYRAQVVDWVNKHQNEVIPPFEWSIKTICALAWQTYLVQKHLPVDDIFEDVQALNAYFNNFVQDCNKRGWAGEVSFVALSMANNVCIRIFQEKNDLPGQLHQPIVYNPTGITTYNILYNGVNHYDALIHVVSREHAKDSAPDAGLTHKELPSREKTSGDSVESHQSDEDRPDADKNDESVDTRQETQDNTEQYTSADEMWARNRLLKGLHLGLTNLGPLVILIEWVGDWKAFLKTWRYEKGPLFPFTQHLTGAENTVTDLQIYGNSFKDNNECFGCKFCNRIFPSSLLLTRHVQEYCFGNGLQPSMIRVGQILENNEVGHRIYNENHYANFVPFTPSNKVYNCSFKTDTNDFARSNEFLWYNNLQELRFLSSERAWKQIDSLQHVSNFLTRRKYSTMEIDVHKYTQVGVDKKHCCDLVVSKIVKIQQELVKKQLSVQQFEDYLETYKSELISAKLTNSQQTNHISMEAMRNFARHENAIIDLQRLLQNAQNLSSMNVADLVQLIKDEQVENKTFLQWQTNRYQYLPLDPRRIEETTKIYAELEKKRATSYKFEDEEEEDKYEDDLEFYTITVFAHFTKEELLDIIKQQVETDTGKRLLARQEVIKNAKSETCSIHLPLTSSSIQRLTSLLAKLNEYGTVTWTPPNHGFNVGQQILRSGKVSPVFTLIWDAWMQDIAVGPNLALLTKRTQNHMQTNGNNVFYTATGVYEHKDLVKAIEDEHQELQTEYGFYKDSTTYWWQPTPTKDELYEHTEFQLKQRHLQCVEIVCASLGSDDCIRTLHNKIWKTLYPWDFEKRHQIVKMIMDRQHLSETCRVMMQQMLSASTPIVTNKTEFENIDKFEHDILQDSSVNRVPVVRNMSVAGSQNAEQTQSLLDRNLQVFAYLTQFEMHKVAPRPENWNVNWWEHDLPTKNNPLQLQFCKNLYANWNTKGTLRGHDAHDQDFNDKCYILHMYLMLLQLHNVNFDGTCQLRRRNAYIIQPLQTPIEMQAKVAELRQLLQQAKNASQKRLDKLAFYLRLANLEPYTVKDMNIIFEVGVDVWINFIDSEEKTKKQLGKNISSMTDNVLAFTQMVKEDTKGMNKYRSETRKSFVLEDTTEFQYDNDCRHTRGWSKNKKKNTFKNEQKARAKERDNARSVKNAQNSGHFDQFHDEGNYCIRLSGPMNVQRGRTLARLADGYGAGASGAKYAV